MGLLVFFAFLFFLGFVFYICIKRVKYTRERFAFYASSFVFSYSMTVYTHVFYNKSLLHLLVEVFNLLPVEDLEYQATSWSDKIWSILFLIIITTFVYAIFRNWAGAESKKDHDLKERKREMGFLSAALNGIPVRKIDIYKGDVVKDSERGDRSYIDLSHLDKKLDWHSEVRDLLIMSSHHYKILDKDWHASSRVYIGRYFNELIGVFCCLSEPDDKGLEEAIAYCDRYSNTRISRLLVAVKNSEGSSDKRDFFDDRVELFDKESLLDGLVDFSEYFDYIKSQFCTKDIVEGEGDKLVDIYVESSGDLIDLAKSSRSIPIDNVERYLLSWANEKDSSKQMSLLGEYGQGKSVLCLKLAYQMITEGYSRVPVIIELRGKSPRNESVVNIIASWAALFHINPMAVFKLLQEGRLLIILEGFDEIDMIGDSNRRLEHFKRLWEFARYEKSKVIITGRPNLFLDNNEAIEYLRIDDSTCNLYYSEPINLKPFDIDRIKRGLRNADSSVRREIMLLLSEGGNDSFIDLISRPSTLYQASVIWDRLDKNNVNSATVINEFINHAYRRQEEKLRNIGPTGIEPTVLTADEREYFMLGVAVGMVQKNDYSNQISKSDLEVIVARLFYEVPDEISKGHVSGKNLATRLKDQEKAVEIVFNDVRTSGILVRDLTQNDSFKFAHKSFLEFLLAKYYFELVANGEKRCYSDSVYRALSFETVYDIGFSEEVVSHISLLMKGSIKTDVPSKVMCKEMMDIINPKLGLINRFMFGVILGVPLSLVYLFLFCITCGLGYWVSGENSFVGFYPAMIMTGFLVLRAKRQKMIELSKDSFNIWVSTCSQFADSETIHSVVNDSMIEEMTSESSRDKYIGMADDSLDFFLGFIFKTKKSDN